MATLDNKNQPPQNTAVSGQTPSKGPTGAGRQVGSPISNDAYNIITALQAKLEGLEAYRKYTRDGGSEIWEQLCEDEIESVGVLVDELERIVKEGKLRLGLPGSGPKSH